MAQRIRENDIGTRVIEAAIEIHRELGPGLLESVYEVVLASELTGRGLKVARQVAVPITYKGITRCVNGLEENPLCAPAPLREKRTDFQPPADI